MDAVVSELNQILQWIRFNDQDDWDTTMNDAFITYANLMVLKENNITSISDSYSKRTVVNVQIIFGLRRTNKLQVFLYWTKDFIRLSMAPTIRVLIQDEFIDSLTIST